MKRIPIPIWLTMLVLPLIFALADAALPTLSVTPNALELAPGATQAARIANANGTVRVSVANTSVASARINSSGNLSLTARASGTTTVTVRDSATSVQVTVIVSDTSVPLSNAGYTLLAWNDIGMHCMDGDYSVFSILPPANTVHAQLINRTNNSNKVVTDGVTLTYEAMADADGSINTVSSTKSNFWLYAKTIFGADLAEDVGLAGNPMATSTPHPLQLDAARKMFVAKAIPITPYDDAGNKNTYPMVKVVARDSAGRKLAQARVVLPVSDEMSCAACHAANSGAAARPAAGWITDPYPEREWKKNILRLHDEKQLANPKFKDALKAKGYDRRGLLATAESGKPMLCASCHASNAMAGTGVTGVKPLTQVIHAHHANVRDPVTRVRLNNDDNRNACYQCHPGSETKCLRGVMGNAVDASGNTSMQCQSCHGNMTAVANPVRSGWRDEPTCQACHHDAKRELNAVDSAGNVLEWTDQRYASNLDTPAPGLSLFRESQGHGGLECSACHGAPHAEYPSSHKNDNVLSMDIQGREGTIGECTACHETVPLTANKGPHGMHTIGAAWVKGHESSAKQNRTQCAYCHGADYRGSELSEVKTTRTFSVEGKTKTYAAGQAVTCYDCHNGPNP